MVCGNRCGDRRAEIDFAIARRAIQIYKEIRIETFTLGAFYFFYGHRFDLFCGQQFAKWSKILWNDKTGWVFGGFLSAKKPADISEQLTIGDLIGSWRRPSDGLTFERDKVSVDGPMGGYGAWSLDKNMIYVDIDCEMEDTVGNPDRIKYSFTLQVVDSSDKDNLKIIETWDSGHKIEYVMIRYTDMPK